MPSKITGLHLDGDSIVAVQVRAGLKAYDVISCKRIAFAKGAGPEEALKKMLDGGDFLQSDRFVTQLPDRSVFFRNLLMPFKDRKKIRQTLPFEMETLVPLPVEELVTDFISTEGSNSARVLTVSATKESIEDYLTAFRNCGIAPDLLDVRGAALTSSVAGQGDSPENGLVLDMGAASVCMSLFMNRQVVFIRFLSFKGAGLPNRLLASINGSVSGELPKEDVEAYFRSISAAISVTIHGYQYISGEFSAPEKVFFTGPGALIPGCGEWLNRFLQIPATGIDLCANNRIRVAQEAFETWQPALMSTALSLALRGARKGAGFNLLREEFRVKKSFFGQKKQWRTAAIFLLLILLFFGGDTAVEYYALKSRYDALNSEIEQVFKKTFPNISRIVDPVQQMKVEIQGLKQKGVSELRMEANKGVLDLLKEISSGIPDNLDLVVTRMVIDPDSVSIKGETDTFNSVDRVKNGLAASSKFSSVNISSANLDRTGKKVGFEMKLVRK